MMNVMEYDMGTGGNRGRPPPRIASRLAASRRGGEAKSTEGHTRPRPPSGRADSKASDPGAIIAKRPGSITADSLQQARGRDSRTMRRRGSSDDEASAKPVSRRAPGSPRGYARAGGTARRGSFDKGASATIEENHFRLGQKIEGRYHGKGRWYKGRIIGTNPDGTYDVRYEDGDEDLRLDVSAIKSVDAVETSREDSPSKHRAREAHLPRIGDRVEAKAPGSVRWRMATVVGENRDGLLDVRFRDGTEEKRLEPSLVRVPRDEHGGSERAQDTSDAELFRVGDDIEARYQGKSRWFRGVIRRVNTDQTYDIRYVDGDQETGVDPSLIRSLDVRGGAGGSSGSTIEDYRVGDKVEARFGGRTRWFHAKIERENRDGTFSLLYDDGDVERAVDKSLMRNVSRGGARSGSKSPSWRVVSGATTDVMNDFREGDKVQARYKRGAKWFRGVIRAIGRDGTYNIRYDDGDAEEAVDPGMVKSIGAGSADSLASTTVDKRGEGEFSAGDKVEARYGGRSRWFKATVDRRNRDGTYHLIYADGDEEKAVGKDMIRTLDELPPRLGDAKSASHRSPSRNDQESGAGRSRKLRVGDEIEARYRRGNKWFPGVIRSVNRDGTYDVRYKDGDHERDIDPLFIRVKGSVSIDSLASSEGGFSKGDKVEARFRGRSRWFKATVERDNRDNTFHLLYKDGDEEKTVSRDLIRRPLDEDSQEVTKAGRRGVPDHPTMGGNDSDSDVNRYRIGDDIEARYKRGRKWYPGEIRATNRDGTYGIRYKDGDTENDVDTALIRRKDRGSLEPLTASAIDGEQGDFAEGEKVEARLGGRWRWLKATVERRNRDGTYYIMYINGEEERAVGKKLIRRLSIDRGSERPSSASVSGRAASSRGALDANTPARKSIGVGDEIESRYKGRRKWYPGVVRAVNSDGTYEVQYKAGDIEHNVIASFVRVVSTIYLASDDAVDIKSAGDEYVKGDKVEARFRGHSRWFTARVSKVNRDDTYHLVYDDGDEERSVPKELMRELGRDMTRDSKDEHRSDATQDAANGLKKHRVGDEIEARYKQGHKWFAGVILAVNRDGTCDIRYSDGDSEREVEPAFIRNKVGPNITSSDSIPDYFVEGDVVEARFGGRSRWFKATVERKNRDKTYYLRYADGDEERSVEKDLIRRVTPVRLSRIKSPGRHVVSGAESDPDSSALRGYRVGDDVDVRYRRGQKWYPGVVRSVNSDGTYDIRYNDGESEQDVVSRMIRGAGASRDTLPSITSLSDGTPGDGNAENFAVSEKVEARFGRRSRWFEATVERKNRDGTYHLHYNDGNEERNVERDLIRRVDADGRGRSGDRFPDRRMKSITEADRAGKSTGEDLREGDEIEARYRQGRKWFPGVIRTVNRDGTYKIRYNDGDIEHSVQRGSIREKGSRSVDRPASPSVVVKNLNSFIAGDEVEARLGGRARWFRATVERKNRNGTYHLLYSDGEEERMVEKELIRRVDRGGNPKVDAGHSKREDSAKIACERVNSVDSISSNGVVYRVGDKVEARFRGGSRWFKASIEGENLDGTFRLLYADGDKERAVHASLIRRLAPKRDEAKSAIGDSSDSVFRAGDTIEARYKRGTRWYPGVIRVVNLDSTFDIRYKDGDSESGVPVELVRSAASYNTTSIAPNEASSFATGERVEARYGGRSRWLKATVERKNRNGTYHLLYDNGDQEKGVERNLVRKIDKGGKDSDARSFTRRVSSGGANSETDEEVREIARGDCKSRSPSKRGKGLPSAADRIEARFRGGRVWMTGRVSRVHRDGSYDITYGNGDKERSVPADHVRRAGPSESSNGSDSKSDRGATDIMEGGRIEVRLDGRTWQKATVTRVNSDSTYDVRCRNGEQHKRVNSRLVRPLGNALSLENVSPSQHRSEGSSRGESNDSRGKERGRSRERKIEHQHPVSEKTKAAATRVRRALRNAGKTVDELKRKLERADSGQGIDQEALEVVLAGIGADITHREARDLYRSCVDVDNDNCIDLSSLIPLLHRGRGNKRSGSSARRRSSSSRHRHHHSSSSTSDVSFGAQRRSYTANRSQGTDRSSRHESRSDLRTDRTLGSRQRSSSARRGKSLLSRIGTTSESDEGGSTSSSDGRKGQEEGGLLSKRGFIGLRKLEGPAFDGSLRREFEKLSGGRGRDLSTSKLKRLLRQLRVKMDTTVFGELVSILDSEDIGSIALGGLLEAALSTSENKKVAKIHADIGKQLFVPDARGSKRQNSKKAKALSASVSKTLSKMEQPKNSGLVLTGSLKKLLQKVGAITPYAEGQVLGERLDPDNRGKIDREAFVLWLTTGFDLHQAESRASRQLNLLESTVPRLERIFKEFDVHREGMVTKNDFISAIRRLGLVLTHGQAVALATEHHEDYERFISNSSKLGKKRSSSKGECSDDSDDESTDRPTRARSKIHVSGRGTGEGSSDGSDRGETSGPNREEETGKGAHGVLLGKAVRMALRDVFERACSSTGGVREAFDSVRGQGKRSGDEDRNRQGLTSREQMQLFIRRLKLDLCKDDRMALVEALTGPRGDQPDRRRHKRRPSQGGTDDENSGVSGVRILYRDFLELLLAEQESKEVSRVFGIIWKDLAKIADTKRTCPFTLVAKTLRGREREGTTGFVKASDFKRGLEKIGIGNLSAKEKSLLVRRFDPDEEGMINYELFAAWVSSGIDEDRLLEKMGRLLGQLTGRESGGKGQEKEIERKRAKRLPKGGVRAVFEAIDRNAEGTVTQHDMRVVLREKLGLPLAEGDLKALFRYLDKDSDGMLDYEEMLVLASTRKREGDRGMDGDNDTRGGLFSKLKRRGSAFVKGATGHVTKQQGRDMANDDGASDYSSETGTQAEEDEEVDEIEDEDKTKDEKKRRENSDRIKQKKEKHNSKADGRRGGRSTSTRASKRERCAVLGRLRVSILQQSAVAAREKYGDENNRTDPNVQMDWMAMFDRRHRSGSGRAKRQDLEAVLEEGGAHLSGDEVTLLFSRFEAPIVRDGDRMMSDGRKRDGEDEDSATYMDYEAFVRWLSEGGLDDAVLLKVQRHIKGRLSKTMNLRTLFSEMCGGVKEQLSASRLAKGLRHASLPLDRAVVDQLIEIFSGRGGRGRHLFYADFHRMVHCDTLQLGGLGAMNTEGTGGFVGLAGNLDEKIRSTLLETIEQAFAFYDEDNSNSIDAAEFINILRAMGHEPSRKESRALLRKADADRNGVIQYEDFQEAVMPFLLQRSQSKRLTEGEMRAIFDDIDKDGSGVVKREDFAYLFCRKLRLLSQHEVETLLGLLDRHQSGQVSWEEFTRLFELINDQIGDGAAAALNPDVKEVVAVALRKLQMGCMPDVEGQLSSFSGMPTTCRKSVLAPLDQIKELSLQWVLMPKLDSHGCMKLQDMSVKVTTEVAEVEATKVPSDDARKVLVKTTNLFDRASTEYHKKTPPRTWVSTLGFGKREISPPPAAVSVSKGIKTRRKSSILGMGLMETTTTITKHAELQEVGASTDEGTRRRNGREQDPSGVMQVELSVKHAYGIPVPKDSRASDIRQRGMRACLFYDASSDADRDAGEATSEYGEHFLCNTYKTLAIQHPQKEEQWLFPDSAEGERKFLVRTDFGKRGGRDQGVGQNVRSHVSGSRDRLFLLVELTCTVQTAKDRNRREDEDGGYARGASLAGGGAVRGPLRNFRAASSRTRRRKSKWGGRGVGSESSDGNSSGDDDEPDRRDIHKGQSCEGESDTASESDSSSRERSRSNKKGSRKQRIKYFNDNDKSVDTATGSGSDGETAGKRQTTRGDDISRRRGGQKTVRGYRGRASREQQRRERKSRSTSPSRHERGRTGASTYMSQDRRGVRSEGPRQRKYRGRKGTVGSGGSSDEINRNGLTGASSGDSDSLSSRDRSGRREEGRGGWRGPWRGLKGGGHRTSSSERRAEDVVELEMSCGWVLIPFLELVETQEVSRVRYNLSGGTPFAKTNINEDEVMTRRYGWRALLKALKIEGTHKGSEVEIKILPVKTLRKVKQEDISRLPRNVVLSDTFVSLVRYYREYTANSLARRSAKGMGNAGFGAGLGSSEPVLALFPRLAADPALMMALKNQWNTEVCKSHVDGRLGATLSAGLANIGIGSGGDLTGATGAARGAVLTSAFEKAVMKLWPAYCHIDAQRRAESYEEFEARSQKIRQILTRSDSFRSDTPTNVSHGGDGAIGNMHGVVGNFLTPDAHESGVMVAFTLKEVAFDVT